MGTSKYTVAKIVERFSNAITDLAEVQKAINISDTARKEKCMSDAGEAISQTFEWALHCHIQSIDANYFSVESKPSTPKMIEDCYMNGTTPGNLYSNTISGEPPSVDFSYLRDKKGPLTNNRKHLAAQLDYEVQKKYASEVAKYINEYLDNQVQLLTIDKLLAPDNDKELSFYSACNSFSHQDCLYLLLLDKRPEPTQYYSNLSRITWDLVIDLYMGSKDNGFLRNALITNSIPSKVISVTDRLSEDTFPLYNGEIPVILANGFTGKAIPYDKARDWNKYYATKLTNQLKAFFNLHSEQKVVVVSLIQDAEFVRLLFSCIDQHARGLTFVIANDKNHQMDSFPDIIGDCIYCSDILCQEVNDCIGRFIPARNTARNASKYQLPAKEGVYSFNEKDLRSYEENFEVLYDGIDEGYSENVEDYLNGSNILSWEGAHRKFAALKTNHGHLYVQKIEKELAKGARKAMLIHEPGYGGTTLARQIAYDLHTKFPTLILKQYKPSSIKTQLEHIYDSTNKSLLVVAEIPQVITNDEFDKLKGQLSSTRPILLLGVKRGSPSSDKDVLQLVVSDWGNDVCLLVDKFKPYLKRYSISVQKEKEKELEKIIKGPSEAYQRTPFYIGLLTFEEDFHAMDSYLKKFVRAVSGNENQRKVLIYLSLCDYFGIKKTIPEGFFATVFAEDDVKGLFRLDERFNKSDGIVSSLLHYDRNKSVRQWQIKHHFFSQKLLPMLLNGVDNTESRKLMNLGAYCNEFIKDIANSQYRELLEESILQQLLIGTKYDREGESFTKIIMELDKSEQEDVLNTLHEQFAENAHFCSHLARYYSSVKKDFKRALELADLSLSLSNEQDAMLYHIKAMCFSHEISLIIDSYKNSPIKDRDKEKDKLNNIIEILLPQANENFTLAREYQRDDEKEITYLPNIYMLIKLFDYAIDVNQLNKKTVLGEAICPYCEWIDEAQSLLESLKQTYVTDESEEYTQCETKLWESIKDFSEVIGLLNNQLDKNKNMSVIRRLLVRTYVNRDGKYKENSSVNQRLLSLMEDNISSDPTDERNYILWLNVVRYSNIPLEAVLSKMNQWRGLNPTRDVVFYSFVFNAVKAFHNDSTAAGLAKNLLEKCKRSYGIDSINIKEWFVNSKLGIKRYKELDTEHEERVRVYGYISNYKHSGDARILLDCGLEVFFKPIIKGITEAQLNSKVSCLIGFSYDGIRALDESVIIEDENQ